MKNKKEEQSKYQHLINQLLTLFFSGVYITSEEMILIGKKLGYELPSKNRELLLKNLFAMAEKDNKTAFILDEFLFLLNERFSEYKNLTMTYPGINEVSMNWAQRINTIKRLLVSEKRGNIYE